MKRIFLFMCTLCIYSCVVLGQFNKEGLDRYKVDVREYGLAVNAIVKEGDYDKGIAILTQLIERGEKTENYPAKELSSYYCCRAQGYIKKKMYTLAIDDSRYALRLLKKLGSQGEKDLCTVWYHLASAYFYDGNQTLAMTAADSCIDVALRCYGKLHTETMAAYDLRSNLAGLYNKAAVALGDRSNIFNIIQKNVEKNFAYLTVSERAAYWQKNLPKTTLMFTFAHKLKDDFSPFSDDLYNQQLLAKGLLITAESTLQRLIDSESELSSIYKQIRALRKKASDNSVPVTEANAATLEADRMERSMGERANSIYEFMDFLKVHVSDIRTALKEDEVAIEFVDYRVGKDSTMYGALVLAPQWEHVHFIPLAEQKDLDGSSSNVAELVWQPILRMLDSNVKTIYFAPTGKLYKIPVESCRFSNGKLISEVYNLYRLSSTRWLAIKHNQVKGKDAIVYGGLSYDTSIKTLGEDAAKYPRQRGLKINPKLRGALKGIPYLAGSKKEADTITKIINNTSAGDMHALALCGEDGTEASFKNLDGKCKRVIHVATHGFYNAGADAASSSYEEVLMRCGLYMAGAENKLEGHDIPEGVEDGVLTALEISALDLRGLDIATLSACQTAQGDIGSDGVFGLQRGFKKAGTNSILMSLWEVDDDATCLLMTEFYKNWIAGKKTKHDALEEAKKSVRSHKERGWDDPRYWAAFILLDALD